MGHKEFFVQVALMSRYDRKAEALKALLPSAKDDKERSYKLERDIENAQATAELFRMSVYGEVMRVEDILAKQNKTIDDLAKEVEEEKKKQ